MEYLINLLPDVVQAIRSQSSALQKNIKSLKKEGFRFVYVLSEEDIEEAKVEFTRLWSDKTDEKGPFDVIGDVHGCFDELNILVRQSRPSGVV